MRSLSFILLLLLPAWCAAGQNLSLPWYVSGFVDRQSLALENTKVRPVVASASVGLWLLEGIGGEIEIGAGMSDDSANNLEFDVASQASFNLRFESAPINGVAAYASFGLTRSAFDTRFTSVSASALKQSFRGFRGVFGLVVPLSPRWAVDAAFTRHEYDDSVGVNSFRIGMRYLVNDVSPQKRWGWLK